MNTRTLRKLDKLSDQLDAAQDSSEATTKEVQHARQTTENVKRDVRLQHSSKSTDIKRRHSQDRDAGASKNKAAVELGRKGGAATARALTRRQRSALAMKAAKARWNRR